jgi:hypothetical protein
MRGGHGAHKAKAARAAGKPARVVTEVLYDDSLSPVTFPDETPEAIASRLEARRKAADLKAHRMWIARKRWGAKGVRFLQAHSNGESVTQASNIAGVSRQTGHKYLRELEKNALKP